MRAIEAAWETVGVVSPLVPRRRSGAGLVIVVTVPGWLVLVGAYGLVLPVFGVVSPVTWTVAWLGWLSVIAAPGLLALRWAARGAWRLAAGLGAVVLLAGFRDELAALAADYRNGSIDAPVALPLWLRPLSIDGRAHPRCGGGQQDCALYLPMWQSFRAEQGAGIAYYPAPPGRDASLATAAGDVGAPVRELGNGWWLID